MEKIAKQLEYFVTSLVLVGVGLLFFTLNSGVNSYTVLRFSLFQILQGILVLISGLLLAYRTYVARQEQLRAENPELSAEAPPEGEQSPEQQKKEAVDSINATMILVVVAVLVIGYYLFTLKTDPEVVGTVAPLHLVICVVTFIAYACVERWWATQVTTNRDAASICNLMVLNKVAIVGLGVDMLTSFTGLFSVQTYVNYLMIALFFYVAVMALVSVVLKVLRHGKDMSFQLYIVFPAYYYGGKEEGSALEWLERNTGISMRSLWSLKYIRMALPACAFAAVMLLWLSTCVVQVESYQQGALYRFGRLAEEDIVGPGLHIKLPTPFEEIKIYNVSQPQSMIVGYEGDVNSKNNLWTRPHEGEEQALLTGGGKELVAINLKITYRISNLYDYLTNYANPEKVLNAKGYEIVMDETISTDIDTVISSDRSVLSHRIEEKLKEYVEQSGLGLEVMSVALASIHPPVAIADVYQSVVSAGIQKKTAILTAEGEALVAREQAQAEKQIAINSAGILRDERVSAANAEIEEYNASIEAYQISPQPYYLTKFMDTFEATMSGRKKYLLSPDVDPASLYANVGVNGSQWFGQTAAADANTTQEGK